MQNCSVWNDLHDIVLFSVGLIMRIESDENLERSLLIKNLPRWGSIRCGCSWYWSMITKTRKQNVIQWLKEYGNNNFDSLVISKMAYFSWATNVMPTSQIFLDVLECHLNRCMARVFSYSNNVWFWESVLLTNYKRQPMGVDVLIRNCSQNKSKMSITNRFLIEVLIPFLDML